jgi:hypothetical protein
MKRRKMLRVGQRVRVADCSGIDSNKEGVVISPSRIRVNARGVLEIPGHYKPTDWSKERAVLLDDGNVITMFKDRLVEI